MKYLEPWYAVTNPASIEAQLKSEMPQDHVLLGVNVIALAQRQDCDDFLFSLQDDTNRVAVVHLTYSHNIDARWPRTELYANIDAWASERMMQDHAEFDA